VNNIFTISTNGYKNI